MAKQSMPITSHCLCAPMQLASRLATAHSALRLALRVALVALALLLAWTQLQPRMAGDLGATRAPGWAQQTHAQSAAART